MYQLILASGSQRRKEILEGVGIHFRTILSNALEDSDEKDPSSLVISLAKNKAVRVANQLSDTHGDYVVLGADTMVFHNKKALGKPKDKEDAYQMLKSLSGDVHEVITGVSIIIMKHGEVEKYLFNSTTTKVFMHELSDTAIHNYIETNEPMDKAGAYAIQGKFAVYIERIEGDYFNVVGLPITDIYQILLKEGIDLFTLA